MASGGSWRPAMAYTQSTMRTPTNLCYTNRGIDAEEYLRELNHSEPGSV
jgi:hypothetical protein